MVQRNAGRRMGRPKMTMTTTRRQRLAQLFWHFAAGFARVPPQNAYPTTIFRDVVTFTVTCEVFKNRIAGSELSVLFLSLPRGRKFWLYVGPEKDVCRQSVATVGK